GAFQGIYIGAGPYFSLHSATTIDQGLTNVLATGIDAPNAIFPITEGDEGQLALAVTGGYRGRFALPAGVGSGSMRDGLYVAFNYNYLKGFAYNKDTLTVKFTTDNTGAITNASNIRVDHNNASSGTGFALDFGVGAVIDRWQVG